MGKTLYPKKNDAIKDDVNAILNLRLRLEDQLEERMYFIKPKDMVVGDLLMFLGDLYSLYIGVKYALPLYQVAKLYTVSNPDLLEKRLEQAKKMALLENPKLIIEEIEVDEKGAIIEPGKSKTTVVEPEKGKTPTEKNYSLYYILAGLSVFIMAILGYFLLRKK